MGYEFKFIHCADLHLGSRFKGLGDYDSRLAEMLRLSVFESFERIVDAALDRHADALVISGDVFDDSNELPSTRMWFVRQLSRLTIPVFICRGNHDSMTSWDSAIPYPDNVHEFGTDVESIDLGDVQVIGASYAEAHETRNLVAMMKGDADKFTIACVHCDIDSCSEGYPYAPCSQRDFVGSNVDYWALGHIHKRSVVSRSPYVVYPGNIQGHSFKETGDKGAYFVDVVDGQVRSLEFFPTQSVTWQDPIVDITGSNLSDVVSELSAILGKGAIARIRFVGTGELDTMLRSNVEDVRRTISASTGAIVSEIQVQTSPEIDMDSLRQGKDMKAALIRAGDSYSRMSKEDLIERICRNKQLSRNRDFFESLSEDDLRSLVSDAVKNTLVIMEASR